ncbi:MAG: phosphoenolpyruvate-protein phosphotransferase PtsP, partial [Pseudomonadales bacterium]
FLSQVRAMMKASVGLNNLRIMLPMISYVKELDEALVLIRRAHAELVEEGIDALLPSIGVMVEVPAAVYLAAELAKRVDFLSVGSNDLTQYLLAVDRNNPSVAELYNSYHPAVLQALVNIASASHAAGKPVSICGELAGDPGAAVLLMAMGYDSLSMNATNLPKVKSVLRSVSKVEADALLAAVMEMHEIEDIRGAVEALFEEKGITRLFRNRITKK